jgi:hypothetical protein
MGNLDAFGEMALNSYTTHEFAVSTTRGAYKEETFTVASGQTDYSVFGSDRRAAQEDETPAERRVRRLGGCSKCVKFTPWPALLVLVETCQRVFR